MRDHVCFYLNGQKRIVRGDDAFLTLAEYLRWNLHLCGTKVVCAEGDCGACTVLVGRPIKGGINYLPIDACIQFVFQIDSTHVITVEGLGSNGELDAVQAAMVEHHGSQCGYCTPGIVMALAGWTEQLERQDERIAMTGNLCRCTGYAPILEAMKSVTAANSTTLSERRHLQLEPRILDALLNDSLQIDGTQQSVFAPTNLAAAIAHKNKYTDAVIVAGATELGVWRNKKDNKPKRLLSLSRAFELNTISMSRDAYTFSANTTWSEIESVTKRRLPQFHAIIQRFGSPQIRNTATLVGNIANGSPIADSLPLFAVMNAELEIAGLRGMRQRSINGFYRGYKKTDLKSSDIITRVTLPMPSANERLRLYKVSRRNDLDISTFCAAIRLRMEGDTIETAAIAYGGVAPTVVRLPKTEQFLIGHAFDEATMREAGRIARSEVTPITDVRGSADFRLQLCENVLRKFYFDEVGAKAEAVA